VELYKYKPVRAVEGKCSSIPSLSGVGAVCAQVRRRSLDFSGISEEVLVEIYSFGPSGFESFSLELTASRSSFSAFASRGYALVAYRLGDKFEAVRVSKRGSEEVFSTRIPAEEVLGVLETERFVYLVLTKNLIAYNKATGSTTKKKLKFNATKVKMRVLDWDQNVIAVYGQSKLSIVVGTKLIQYKYRGSVLPNRNCIYNIRGGVLRVFCTDNWVEKKPAKVWESSVGCDAELVGMSPSGPVAKCSSCLAVLDPDLDPVFESCRSSGEVSAGGGAVLFVGRGRAEFGRIERKEILFG